MNPAIDPWIITNREEQKFKEQFKSLNPQNGIVTGAQAKGFFLQSQLPPLVLGKIWSLADRDSDGKMDICEFSLACKLINLKLRGFEIPDILPPSLIQSLASFVQTANATAKSIDSFNIIQDNISMMSPSSVLPSASLAQYTIPSPGQAGHISTTTTDNVQNLHSIVGSASTIPAEINIDSTNIIIGPKSSISDEGRKSSLISSPTSVLSNQQIINSESESTEWGIKSSIKLKYTQIFNSTDRNRTGYLSGSQARNLMVQTKLPQSILAQVWTLSDMDADGKLNCDEFVLAMYFCDRAISGEKIPTEVPTDLIPPSYRKINSGVGALSKMYNNSLPTSRHSSISSQGVSSEFDPTAGLSQASFEDKRKENYDKGQAELDRRRKLLLDQQKKEQDEREKKEKEETERKEKARLEIEKKQQEELEKQMQQQRDSEIEKEEQRQRIFEAKETAKRELEKQRQIEWENQKISELQMLRNKEQEKVLKCKAQNQTLLIELDTLNSKIKDLSQKICETRANVTNVKTFIDGMRVTRDTQMSEMTQLKIKIKEQNHKLLLLTQEKAKWDSKSKNSQASDAVQEQMSATFTNRQLIITHLKDKIQNIKSEVLLKKTDINSNNVQLEEVKSELRNLILKCEELYISYDNHRNQVVSMKNSKRNNNSSIDLNTDSKWTTNEESIPQIETIKYQAIYEFVARNEDEISFQPGDILEVSNEISEPGWLKGFLNDHCGWFPENYAEIVELNEQAKESIQSEEPIDDSKVEITNTTELSEKMYDSTNEYYIATYPYESAEPDDLNFGAGEIVVVSKKEGDWWTGTIGSKTGLFPSNYVQKADIGRATDKDTINSNIEPVAFDKQNEIELNEIENKSVLLHSDETRTQEDLDIEVSQINTQQKYSEQSQGSFSRPMSRTSSMTPGMRGKKGEIAQVVAPYEASSTEQLSLVRGQLIMIRKKTDSGWWEGELQAKGRRRQIGWFPASYVKILQGGRNSGRNTPVSGSKIDMNETILDKVIALYPYKAQNDDELSFEKDDIISVLGRDEPDWWRGEINCITGLFPSNYVGPFVTSGNV